LLSIRNIIKIITSQNPKYKEKELLINEKSEKLLLEILKNSTTLEEYIIKTTESKTISTIKKLNYKIYLETVPSK
jgi:hypothetical protein